MFNEEKILCKINILQRKTWAQPGPEFYGQQLGVLREKRPERTAILWLYTRK
jgi:hypothetical protein